MTLKRGAARTLGSASRSKPSTNLTHKEYQNTPFSSSRTDGPEPVREVLRRVLADVAREVARRSTVLR